MIDQVQSNKQETSVWPCCKETAATTLNGNPHAARASLQSAVMLIVGLLLIFWLKKPITGGIIISLSLVVLVSGLFIPPVFSTIERFGQKLGHWVGTGMTWLLLVPFFFICFLPGRIIMAVSGKDPLNLKFRSTARTYWIPHKPVADINQYEKQH